MQIKQNRILMQTLYIADTRIRGRSQLMMLIKVNPYQIIYIEQRMIDRGNAI